MPGLPWPGLLNRLGSNLDCRRRILAAWTQVISRVFRQPEIQQHSGDCEQPWIGRPLERSSVARQLPGCTVSSLNLAIRSRWSFRSRSLNGSDPGPAQVGRVILSEPWRLPFRSPTGSSTRLSSTPVVGGFHVARSTHRLWRVSWLSRNPTRIWPRRWTESARRSTQLLTSSAGPRRTGPWPRPIDSPPRRRLVGGPGIAERIGPGVKAPGCGRVRRLRESLGDTNGFGRRAYVQCEVGRCSRKRIDRRRHRRAASGICSQRDPAANDRKIRPRRQARQTSQTGHAWYRRGVEKGPRPVAQFALPKPSQLN